MTSSGSTVICEPRPPQVGQIDDDRDAVRDESLLATVLLSPVRVVGQALEVPVRQIKKTNGQTPLQAARMTTDIALEYSLNKPVGSICPNYDIFIRLKNYLYFI